MAIKTAKKKDVDFRLRAAPGVVSALRLCAELEQRSLSGTISRLVTEGLRARRLLPNPDERLGA